MNKLVGAMNGYATSQSARASWCHRAYVDSLIVTGENIVGYFLNWKLLF